MNLENWYRVDNVSKVFLATHNSRDTRSLRISCTLNETIEPETLTEALKKTIKSGNIFQVRIRRGLFWHYIEPTDAVPEVTEEHDRPCPVLYGKDYSGILHYNVTYFKKRINLEMFHALTDGTGAMGFLNDIVLNYLKIKHIDELSEISIGSKAAINELEQDSFDKFYEKGTFIDNKSSNKSYQIKGLKLPYDQLQFFRVQIPSDSLKKSSKSVGAGMTAYICAKLMMSIYRDMPARKRNLPITISLPVNLRNYYDTETARNFFNSVSVSHTFNGKETIEELSREIDASIKKNLSPESIRVQMNHYQRIERIIALRMVPLMIKQPVVKFFAKKEAKNVSAVFSNLGVIKVPDKMKSYINNYTVFCSHSSLYMSLCTFEGKTVLGITSSIRNTSVLRDFISGFSQDGTEVEIEATEVIR